MTADVVHLLLANAALLAALFVGLWGINLFTRDPSFIDSWWGPGMAVLAASTYLQAGDPGPHRTALTLLCAAWGLRLGGYLLWRWRRHGPDKRYAEMMKDAQERRGWSYPLASGLIVFALQAPLQFIVALPVQLGQASEPGAFGWVAWMGAALAVTGVAFESIGDWQLVRFKADPANKGKVLQTGLWRYTRHPNYFGDACLWWGLWLIAAETGLPGWLSLPGPILITFLLTKGSGAPTTEGPMRAQKPDYEDYVARTSGFFPLPPRRKA